MKIFLSAIIALCLLFSIRISAQHEKETDAAYSRPDTLSSKDFNDLINKQFSKLTTSQTNHMLGSFAALDITEPTVIFSPNYISKNGNIFVSQLKAGVSDQISEIFTNSKLNGNISLDLQYHFINRELVNSIAFDDLDFTNLIEKNIELKYKYSKDLHEIESNSELDQITSDRDKLNKSIENLHIELKRCNIDSVTVILNKRKLNYDKKLNNFNMLFKDELDDIETNYCKIILYKEKRKEIDSLETSYNELKLKLDSLNGKNAKNVVLKMEEKVRRQIKKEEIKRDWLNEKIALMNDTEWVTKKTVELTNNYNSALRENGLATLDLKGFRFGWWSLGVKFHYNHFKLFSKALSPSKQITDTSFISHEFQIQYSYYRWSIVPFSSYFFSASLNYSLKDNFSDLSGTEITETTNHAQGETNRATTSKYTAYTGDYRKGFNELNLKAEFYLFLLNNNEVAIHLFPDLRFSDMQKPIWNAGLGVVFSIPDKDKKGSLINVELYYRLKDLFKATQNTYNIFNHNSIGLIFTFPVIFNI